MDNVVLIGMPGCGKSTMGVLIAKALGLDFMDTDVVIQSQNGDKLQNLLDACGVDAFLQLEENTVAALDVHRTVIATGGSVVYGKRAMAHLRQNGTVVYIKLDYPTIEKRIHNLDSRGVTLREGQTLRDLYEERIPLYEEACDICFEPATDCIEENVRQICALLNRRD